MAVTRTTTVAVNLTHGSFSSDLPIFTSFSNRWSRLAEVCLHLLLPFSDRVVIQLGGVFSPKIQLSREISGMCCLLGVLLRGLGWGLAGVGIRQPILLAIFNLHDTFNFYHYRFVQNDSSPECLDILSSFRLPH